MADPVSFLDQAQRLGMAFAIGFLVGIERGWKQRSSQDGTRVAGVRTFAASGLLGGLCGLLSPIAPGVAMAIALAFAGGFILFHLGRSADGDHSVTSAVAGLAVFSLGAFAVLDDPRLAAAAGVSLAALLAFKQGLHDFLSELTWPEIRSALLILVAAFVVLPFLPAGAIDPWGLIEPQTLLLLTIVLAVASFGGYLALRVLGARTGVIASALLGGLVSSTAVTFDLAGRVRRRELDASTAAAGASLAAASSIARVGAIAAFLSWNLFLRLWVPLGAAFVALTLVSLLIGVRWAPTRSPSSFEGVRSPLSIRSVGWFALVLSCLTILAGLASRTWGSTGLRVFAVTAGLADVDAVVLSIGRLPLDVRTAQVAAESVALALVSNQAFKSVAAFVVGGPALAMRFTLTVSVAIAVAAAGFVGTSMLFAT